MKETRQWRCILSVTLSVFMLLSTMVIPQSAWFRIPASAEEVVTESSDEHLTEVPEGYTAARTNNDMYKIRSNSLSLRMYGCLTNLFQKCLFD